MCGIVGYIGQEEAVRFLAPALRRLEYRGYDSAGVATLNGHGIEICKSAGKIAQLEAAVAARPPAGRLGIAHTRWATHGRPTDLNAHPHVDCAGRIAVVHNGIIENHRELRAELVADGHAFRSDTDTEVIAHLIERFGGLGLQEAVRAAALRLRGSFAIACISEDAPDTIVALRGGGSPLVIGVGDGAVYLASDLPALLGQTERAVVLDDGEMAVLGRGSLRLLALDGTPIDRAPKAITGDLESVEKGGYPHFMLKEIFEQPRVVAQTVAERIDRATGLVHLPELGLDDAEMAALTRISFVGCGTSWHAGLTGKYLVEMLAGLPADVEIASEYRHRHMASDPHALGLFISQSGETADTLAALRHARAHGLRTAAICNIVGSSVARDAGGVIHTRAGIEIGVAATKTFTAQLAAVILLALRLAQARGRGAESAAVARELLTLPDVMGDALDASDRIQSIAEQFRDRTGCLYLGRGLQYPLALEGALKLKEISYIHAEGYPAGEMKHGPIALIDHDMPVVALAPDGPTLDAMASSIQEVKARDAAVLALATRGSSAISALADAVIPVPPSSPALQPLLLAAPLQLFAYHLAVARECDVDQPRNLAKSVTVE